MQQIQKEVTPFLEKTNKTDSKYYLMVGNWNTKGNTNSRPKVTGAKDLTFTTKEKERIHLRRRNNED